MLSPLLSLIKLAPARELHVCLVKATMLIPPACHKNLLSDLNI
jgi:hypothetical protein